MDNGGWNKGPHNVNIIPAPQGQQRWGLERVVLSGHLLHSLRLGQGSGCTWVLLAIAVPRSCRPPRRHNDNRGEGGKQGLLQGLHLAIYQNFSAEKRATSGVKKTRWEYPGEKCMSYSHSSTIAPTFTAVALRYKVSHLHHRPWGSNECLFQCHNADLRQSCHWVTMVATGWPVAVHCRLWRGDGVGSARSPPRHGVPPSTPSQTDAAQGPVIHHVLWARQGLCGLPGVVPRSRCLPCLEASRATGA